MTKIIFPNPFKENLYLERFPKNSQKELIPFDSSDSLILEECSQLDLSNKKILIANDNFGAISCSLQDYDITTYSDSYISHIAIHVNSDKILHTKFDLKQITDKFELVLVKLPKSLAFMEDILNHLNSILEPGTPIIFTGMIKHISKGHFNLVEKLNGSLTTSLAKKKARLIFTKSTPKNINKKYPISLNVEGFETPLVNHSNIFSHSKLDIGTRLFLDNIPTGDYKNILDLGCANGIIGIKAKFQNKNAQITFIDESYMAIKSAMQNYKNYFQNDSEAYWTNCIDQNLDKKFDLILCNPPFHQNHTIGDFIAWQMFLDSKHNLIENGKIIVIGNHHLKYHLKLKKIFKNCEIINKNKKFMIIEATNFIVK